MPINDAKRREMKRKSLLHTRMHLEIAREKGHGVNFTSYMQPEEYEPNLIAEEKAQAKVEVNILDTLNRDNAPRIEIEKQIKIINRLNHPRDFLEQQMAIHNVDTIEELKYKGISYESCN